MDNNLIGDNCKSKKEKNEINELRDERDFFMQTIMHNLKTPVRSEIRIIELLIKGSFGELNDAQKEVLKEVLNSSTQMMFMLDSIILKNKIDKNKVSTNPIKLNLTSSINEVIEELRLSFENKKQTINIKLNNLTEHVVIDYKTLRNALIQVLSNAIKFSPEGNEIDIYTEETPSHINISIKDYGVGMSKEELKTVFNYNMYNYKKFNTIGAGLGLHIAKITIEQQGGDIKVESTPNVGSTFTIMLKK